MNRFRSAHTLSVVCLLTALGAAAATGETPSPEADPAWTLRFESPVLWQRVTPLGGLVVGTAKGLYGVEPGGGGIAWRHEDLPDLSPDGYREILNSPFVLVAEQGQRGRVLILDSMNGRIVFDSLKVGFAQVVGHHLLPRNRALLVIGPRADGGKSAMSLVDVATAEVRWTKQHAGATASVIGRLAAALVERHTGESVSFPKPVEAAGAILIPELTGVSKIDIATGELAWRVPGIQGVALARVYASPHRDDLFFVAAQQTMTIGTSNSEVVTTHYGAFRLSDGSAVWDKPVRMKGAATEILFLERGAVLSSGPDGNGRLKLADYESGESLWGKKGKGIEIQGTLVDHAPLADGGILLVTGHDSAWTNKGIEYYLSILDPAAGTLRCSKPARCRGRLLRTEVVPRGVLYVTTSEVNLLDPATGQPVLKRAVASDGNLVTAERGNVLYAFSHDDGLLYALDKRSGEVRPLSKQKVRLAEKDVPWSLETGDDRITLVSSQNVVGFGFDGAVRFHAHHPSPKQPALLRALYAANAFRAAMASAATGLYGAAFGSAAAETEPGTPDREVASELAHGFAQLSEGYAGLSGDYVRAARARFRASAESVDSVFMMVRLPEQGLRLARVSKATGAIVATIDLGRDRTPDYQVDAIDNRVYYRVGLNEIAGYAF